MKFAPRLWSIRSSIAIVFVVLSAQPSKAGGPPFHWRGRVMVETFETLPRPQDRVARTGMLGTFYPSPTTPINDNTIIGQNRSPLGSYGRENSLSVYGPLSVFRATSAPLTTVVRGYDGIPIVVQGTSFSNPLRPSLSPVIYPTRASNYSALKYQTTSPRRDSSILWLDLD